MKIRPGIAACLLALAQLAAPAQERVKNVILLIPDGTSYSVLTLARWYQFGSCVSDRCRLAVDPYLCGYVKTFSSDAPIGDSAPTSSCYATGHPSQSGFIATYPPPDPGKDLVPVDPRRAYQPLYTILEAAKLMGKSTGLVATSEFFHATPADFAAHTAYRWNYDRIAKQMVYNRLNIVFGGGSLMLEPGNAGPGQDLGRVLRDKGYTVVRDMAGFRSLGPSDTLVYGLFAGRDLPYDLDRDPNQCPSLAEMTRKAIQSLSQNPNGFFLMVEGSKIDWAAHANDPVGTVTEYLAFDRAVKEAMDFANRDGYTAVIVLPDHATGGVSIGNSNTENGYDTMGATSLVKVLKECRYTAKGLADRMRSEPDSVMWADAHIQITDAERAMIDSTVLSSYSEAKALEVAKILTKRSCVGFTTTGHTGDDVFLSVYHPGNYRPEGLVLNTEINSYLCTILGAPSLDSLSDTYFSADTAALKGFDWTLAPDPNLPGVQQLVIQVPGEPGCTATVEAYTDLVRFSCKGKPSGSAPLGGVAVYMGANQRFYLPVRIGEIIKNHRIFTKKQAP